MPTDDPPQNSAETPGKQPNGDSPLLSRELGGDLPCVVCGYNLRGLSIRSVCPECGVGVRATILAVVDPQARELQPVRFPRLIATGLVAWAAGGLAAALLCWLPSIAEALQMIGVKGVHSPMISLGVTISIVVSAVGSLAFIRPQDGVPRSRSILSALGCALYVPLTWMLWSVLVSADLSGGPKYFSGWSPTIASTVDSVAASILMAAIILCLRPVARILVARSLLMRTGRVDRQTMLAIAAAAGLMATGYTVGYFFARPHSGVGDIGKTIGIVIVAAGSILLTIGLFGSLADCIRIARAILFPRPTLRHVIRHGKPASSSRIIRMLEGDPGKGIRP